MHIQRRTESKVRSCRTGVVRYGRDPGLVLAAVVGRLGEWRNEDRNSAGTLARNDLRAKIGNRGANEIAALIDVNDARRDRSGRE